MIGMGSKQCDFWPVLAFYMTVADAGEGIKGRGITLHEHGHFLVLMREYGGRMM